MDRQRKKDILNMVAMLKEANDFVAVKAVYVTSQNLAEMFMRCQNIAVQIGLYLGGFGEKYKAGVYFLEGYCENINQLSIMSFDESAYLYISKKIEKQLIDLENLIRYEIPEDRMEVVFLPYKAAMWDSLESVWRAADADENTEAYVIPIPYYDRNPDGSFREEHYEGDLYPDYVPITSYKEYNFESRRPDVIFIHNAYDNANYVTSVHPYFYSSNLKKFTQMLVYIPYFILPEIKPDDKAAVTDMRHFCIVPGIFNADKVIVQSEDMRQIYINVLTDEVLMNEKSTKHREVRNYWKNKIVGSGSPKIDKVLNTKKNDINIPPKWLNIIIKPDGTWKKIVFYNISVTALLQQNEKLLRKMEDVFRFFYENRDDVALLWRPHPLIESTLTSMRPQLWEAYRSIRDNYLRGEWGIYDDTADIDRAIVLSDAYYGDASSVVQLYQKTGKWVMIQDSEVS